MFATPLRWLLMFLVAACGYFIITSNDSGIRATAFLLSVIFWQIYCVILMYEADRIRSSGTVKSKIEKPPKQDAV